MHDISHQTLAPIYWPYFNYRPLSSDINQNTTLALKIVNIQVKYYPDYPKHSQMIELFNVSDPIKSGYEDCVDYHQWTIITTTIDPIYRGKIIGMELLKSK